MNNSYTALIKQYYHTAHRQASEFCKQYAKNDKFADEILLISFDLTLQLSVLQLKSMDWEVSPDEIRYLFNICNSARIFEFLNLTFGLDITLLGLCQLGQEQFGQCLTQIEKVLAKHTQVFVNVAKEQQGQHEIRQLKMLVTNILTTLLHLDEVAEEDLEVVNKTMILSKFGGR